MLTERSLKIGFLTTEYPTEGYTGGIGSYVRQMAHSLVGLGHSVVVLLSVPSGEGITWDGPVPIHKLQTSGFTSRLPWPLGKGASLSFAKTLARLAKELDLDLLEAPEWRGLTAFLSLVKPEKLRIVVRLHTCDAIVRHVNELRPASMRERIRWYTRDWTEKRSILTADAVTAVSKSIGGETRKALRLAHTDFQVVPNSVNDSVFSLSEVAVDTSNPVVLFIGRLEWRKGPDLLIRAMPVVLERYPDVLFRFAGSNTLTGPKNTSMQSYLDGSLPCGARSNVDFCGHLGLAQLEEALCHATVCVFPSRYEGLPMVCLEAMACGKAIVAADIPGFRELLSDGESGIIVKQEDPEDLAEALCRLIADSPLRSKLGRTAREKARSLFHTDVVANSMLKVYRKVLTENKSSRETAADQGEGLR